MFPQLHCKMKWLIWSQICQICQICKLELNKLFRYQQSNCQHNIEKLYPLGNHKLQLLNFEFHNSAVIDKRYTCNEMKQTIYITPPLKNHSKALPQWLLHINKEISFKSLQQILTESEVAKLGILGSRALERNDSKLHSINDVRAWGTLRRLSCEPET